MIIIPTGYMNSGSSAITDLLSEFKDFSNVGKTQEFIFMHCPYGILDLEKSLLKPISHLSSKEAIKNFRNMMHKLYDLEGWWPSYYKTYISEDFMKYVDNYLNAITDHKYKGFWYMDEFPIKRTILSRIKNKIKKVDRMSEINMTLAYPTEEKFYKESKKFIQKVINDLNKDNQKNIIIDQLLLPYNGEALNKYFDNTKLIIVERDPRDVFILNKESISIVPFPTDALEFTKMYKNIRNLPTANDKNNVLKIKFEDLVYNYEKTLMKIYKFLEVDSKNHVDKKSRFIPEKSINNTQLFINYKNQDEIKIIERELKEYLYDFPYAFEKEEREVF